MLFVKCVSPPKYGRFTPGRIYIAFDDLEGEAASRTSFHLPDDYGAKVGSKFSDGHFIEQTEVYVCCIKSTGDFKAGEIVKATGVDEGSFQLAGFGWFNSTNFEILDSSNISIGNYVWDEPANKWVVIQAIHDDDQAVQVNGDKEFRLLNDFSLPVEDGAITTCPKSLTVK